MYVLINFIVKETIANSDFLKKAINRVIKSIGLAIINAGIRHIHFLLNELANPNVAAHQSIINTSCRIFTLNGPTSTHMSNIHHSTCLGTIIFILFLLEVKCYSVFFC